MDATQDPHEIERIVALPELLELFGAVTDEDRRALDAAHAGSFDAFALDPAQLSTAFAHAIASDADYAIYERARSMFERLRSREIWSRTAPAATVAALARYAQWMEVAAQAARAESSVHADSDYAIEAAAAARFAAEAATLVAELVARNGRGWVRAQTRTAFVGLTAALAERITRERARAARCARAAAASLSHKLHGLHHTGLSARIAQVGRAAS